MKNKIFDFRLYLQGLGRLRVIGIALAILCLTVSILVPTVRWLNGPSNYYRIEHPIDGDELIVEGSSLTQSELERLDGEGELTYYKIPETISDRATIVPVTVASYFSPVLVLMMFAFLNKRKESDFYHAIPFTRGCVYTSFVAAILTWMWGVLIVSSLSAALVWALCPYVTFSFGGLLTHMLLACLNAALLAAFTAVAVSLTGTATTAVVTTLLVMWSWRLVLLFARMSLSDLLRITPINSILGGYLKFSFLLPISIIVGEVTTPMVIYAVVITLALFALGGLLYSKRRSELAGRSVPGRLVHNLLRCLITLPLGLLLTYQFIGSSDFTTTLVVFICMLLVFYLYELLTTKSARRMFRATPWLGAVIGVCIVFFGVMHLSAYVETHERTDADRIKSVEFVNNAQVRENNVVINAYELSQICKTDDADVIAGVSEAWSKSSGWQAFDETSVTVRIKLKGGRTITRNLTFNRAEFATMMGNLQKKEAPKSVPSYDEVTALQISSYGGYRSTVIRVSGEWRARLLQALEADYNSMTAAQKMECFTYYKESILAQLQITTEKDGKTAIYSYGVHGNMTRTMSLLYEIYGKSAYGRAEAAKSAIHDWDTKSQVTIRFYSVDGTRLVNSTFLERENVCSNGSAMNHTSYVLLKGIDRAKSESGTGRRLIVYISGFNRNTYDNDYFDIRFPVSLTESEWIALFGN